MTPATSTPHFTPLINLATYGVEDRSCVWLLRNLSLFNSQFFLDVNTEIEILKATVVKVNNKLQFTLLILKLIPFMYR
jgi:hypothetical protein